MFDEATQKLLQPGTVGIIPTDTVYGIVARAADEQAVARLYKLKNRIKKLGTIIAADVDQLVELGIKRRYLTAVEQFWPGAVSVIIPCSEPRLSYLLRGNRDLAIRIPDDRALLSHLRQTGALLTTSANLPDEPVSTTVEQAKNYFSDRVDFYVDGGDLSDHKPSTIVRIIDDAVEVIREGAVKIDEAGRKV